MHKVFQLREGVTTREVNAVIRDAILFGIMTFGNTFEHTDFNMDERRWRRGGRRRYVFSIQSISKGSGNVIRDTVVARYVPGSGEIVVTFPNDYQGWDRCSFYDRLRVSIYDKIVHHSDIRDKSQPAKEVIQ